MADDQPPLSTPQTPQPEQAKVDPAPVGESASSPPSPEPTSAASAPAPAPTDLAALDDHAAIDELLKQANFEDPSAVTTLPPAPDAAPFELPNFQQVIADAQVSSI